LLTACSQGVSKPVEFYSKNKFEKLVQLVGFAIRIYHDASSPERQNPEYSKSKNYVPVYFCVQQLYSPLT
jgi:hypothetical protein